MMARNPNVPFKGRIQKRKTYHLQIITFRLQRAAGPYSRARSRREQMQQHVCRSQTYLLDHLVGAGEHNLSVTDQPTTISLIWICGEISV